MTAFVLMIFLALPNGDIQAKAHPKMLIGADLCFTARDSALDHLRASGFDMKKVRIECVDSGLHPGVES